MSNLSGIDSEVKLCNYLKLPLNTRDLTKDLAPHINTSYTALQLASVYNFPNGNGSGQKIGIISLGGGYNMSDINTYLSALGINVTPNITNVSVDGAVNNPSDMNSSIEVVLDLEIILAIAPGAAIRMYFAPNSISGFYNAIHQAIVDQCNIVSISWGMYEDGYGSNLTSYNNLFNTGANQGVTFFVAAGDNGSSDGGSGNNVDFPASSPYCVACSGTSLNAVNNVRVSEVVWNNNPTSSATGGGISKYFSKPSYQNNLSIANRGIGDISCNADPATGYRIYYNNAWIVVGGTSASAPLMAGLFARVNQLANTNVGFVHPTLYTNNIYYDVISGNNGSFSATANWDPCSGLGVIDGQALLGLFNNQPILPISSFTYVINGYDVTFTNTSSHATSYMWDFGDGHISNDTNPTHTYIAGSYNITLTVTNDTGSDTSVQTITITDAVADFTGTPLSGIAPLTVQFNNTSTNASTYLWQFGDNQTSNLMNPSHVYNVGVFSVSLTADSNVKTRNNYITVTSGLQANFTYSIVGFSKRKVHFINTSSGSPTSYRWDFGNRNYSTVKNPTNNYNRPGTYNVTLTIYKNGLSSSITRQITV